MAKKEKAVLTAKARNNKLVMMCHLIECSIISIAYLLEFAKGARTLPYVLLTILLGLCTPIAELIVFKKDKESKAIMHLAGIGFAGFYIFIMMTTVSELAFTYAIPMLIVISVYDDIRYKVAENVGALIVNIIQAGMFLAKGVYTMDNLANLEIQVIVMFIISLYSIFLSRTVNENNKNTVSVIDSQREETEKLLSTTMSLSEQLGTEIDLIDEKINELNGVIKITADAMKGVSAGAGDTADAVQEQLVMTQNIQKIIEDVRNASTHIADSVDASKQAVEDGKRQITGLIGQVNATVEAGNKATLDLGKLQDVMSEMNSVVDIITNITSQTSLLSLNASIEAARAGEAGKGFAVVASEISKMANETEEATVQITEMIDNVLHAIDNVVAVTGHMVQDIAGQKEVTNSVAESLGAIGNQTDGIVSDSRKLAKIIVDLAEANDKITDSISTISAISEEVSAHASDTLEASEQNGETVAEVLEVSQKLKELADQLNN